MQTIRITTPQNIDIDYEIAGIGERIVARLIDMGLFILILFSGLIIAGITGSMGSELTITVLIIIYAIMFVFYDLICEITMNGQSFGKRIMKIKIISLNGARPTLGQYMLRWLFRIVDFSLTFQACGLICAAVSDKTQRLGDIVAGTTLIKTHPRTTIDTLAFTPVAENYVPVFNDVTQLKDHDIVILQEVINTYVKTGNTEIVYSAARRIKELLAITQQVKMDDLRFLQTILKDYSHISAQADAL